jgi:hypothetical protein
MVVRDFVASVVAAGLCLSGLNSIHAGNEHASGGRKATEDPGFSENASALQTAWSSEGFRSAPTRKPDGDANGIEAIHPPLRSLLNSRADAAVHATILSELQQLRGEPVQQPVNATIVSAGSPEAVPTAARPQYLAELESLNDGTRPWLGMRPQASADAQTADQSQPAWFRELQSLERRVGLVSNIPTAPPASLGITMVSANHSNSAVIADGATKLTELFPKLSDLKLAPASPEDPQKAIPERKHLYSLDGQLREASAWIGPRIDGSLTGPAVHRKAARNLYAFHHQPLYFEQANLERCGKSYGCLTTAASAVHFTASAAVLPWQMAVRPPCEKVRTLGDCPAGCEYPMTALLPDCSLKGAAAEAGVITALIFIIP